MAPRRKLTLWRRACRTMVRGQILASRQTLHVAPSPARIFHGSKATFHAGACARSLYVISRDLGYAVCHRDRGSSHSDRGRPPTPRPAQQVLLLRAGDAATYRACREAIIWPRTIVQHARQITSKSRNFWCFLGTSHDTSGKCPDMITLV